MKRIFGVLFVLLTMLCGNTADADVFADNSRHIAVLKEDDVHKGNLILINSEHEYRQGENSLVSVYSNKNKTYKVKNKSLMLNAEVVEALNRMINDFDYAMHGSDVIVTSGFRTEEDQQKLFEAQKNISGEDAAATWVAKPGFSEHHSGLALDLGLYYLNGTSEPFDGKGHYEWITRNCNKYGFIVRYPKDKTQFTGFAHEPWHLRFVGIPHSEVMNQKNFCFEEYISFLRNFCFDNRLQVSADGSDFEIYYAGGTEIPLPVDGMLEISGNNTDGFIVTVKKALNPGG